MKLRMSLEVDGKRNCIVSDWPTVTPEDIKGYGVILADWWKAILSEHHASQTSGSDQA